MGEIIISKKGNGANMIIDGQQRLTTLTLLLIYLRNNFKTVDNFPNAIVENAISSNDFGDICFNLDIKERNSCMFSLFEFGKYDPTDDDRRHVQNIVDRYNDINDCWNSNINEKNIVCFTFWILEKVMVSRVKTNSDDFAYVIFETMNDRGLSLTQIQMLRSY